MVHHHETVFDAGGCRQPFPDQRERENRRTVWLYHIYYPLEVESSENLSTVE
jgi:hypothetical protein